MPYWRVYFLVVFTITWLTGGHTWRFLFGSPGSIAAEPAATPERRLPEYKPRKADAPRARIGGQGRGVESGTPILIALVPDHVAFTVKNDPTLCWYQSLHTPRPMVLTVVDSRGIRPILEQSLPAPVRHGIHCLRPREYGVEFRVEESYRWYVTVVMDPKRPSLDVVAGGMIERVSLDEACVLGMPCPSSSCDTEGIYRYAESGLWYDAIACLVELIQQEPDKERLRLMLSHLLHQSGVHLPREFSP
ncbi:MAG: DUF928 domain-containing protein [Nitrospira sp.]